jgi:DNA-binding transcriptional ArsR family regulator
MFVLLHHGGATTPSHLARLAGRSVQTVSGHLAKLYAADVVRYDSARRSAMGSSTMGKRARYLRALERVVHAAGKVS